VQDKKIFLVRYPMNSHDLLKKAQLLLVDGKDRESIEAFRKAVEAGADPYICHLSSGAAHLKLKEADEAVNDFSKAIDANNKSARAYFYRGMAYMDKNEFEKAVDDFSHALERKTDYAMAKFSRAVAYARMDKIDEASQDMMAVIPEMEKGLQSFSDSYGILRTEMWKVLAQLSGERPWPTAELGEKEMETVKKWLKEGEK
jgi:tetratricopeptide (TPR) repeat protein